MLVALLLKRQLQEQDRQVLVGEGPCLPLSRGSAFIPHGARDLGHEPEQQLVAAVRPWGQPPHPVVRSASNSVMRAALGLLGSIPRFCISVLMERSAS